ncbi:MAG: hypothetical protein ACI8RZ_006787, partial [Myxococcota bacterium]
MFLKEAVRTTNILERHFPSKNDWLVGMPQSAAPLERSAMSGPKGQRWSGVARKRMALTMADLNHPVREHPSESI